MTLRQRVAVFASLGWSHTDIATAIGISRASLAAKYYEELHAGAVKAKAVVALALYRAAAGGSIPACRLVLGISVREPEAAPRHEVPQPARARGWTAHQERADQAAGGAAIGSSWDDLLPKFNDPDAAK